MRHAKLFSVSEERIFHNESKSASGFDVCGTDMIVGLMFVGQI